MNLNNILKNSNFQERNNTIKKVYGIVKEVNGSNAVVAIQDSLNLTVTLPNKTSEPLKENDNVWVYYWNKISQGYIALKNDDYGLSAKVTDLIGNHMEIGKIDISESDCDTNASYLFKKVDLVNKFSDPIIFTQISYESNQTPTPIVQKLVVNVRNINVKNVENQFFYLSIVNNEDMRKLSVKNFTVNYIVMDMKYIINQERED